MSRFATTRWSLVLAAEDRQAPQAQRALSVLCTAYWYPLYAYVRRRGHDVQQAEDLTQEFFARFLEKDYLQVVDREKGKFRSFLLASFQHFLNNEHDRAIARKRGGGQQHLSLDCQAAEGRYQVEPFHSMTPEKLFERRWALTLLDRVLARLREEMSGKGNGRLFEALKESLARDRDAVPLSQVAAALEMTEAAVKVAAHRLRKRYRALLREEIEQTVHEAGQVEEEIRALFTALGS